MDASNVGRMGLEHDRRMMVVTPEGDFLTQRDYPKLALVTPSIDSEELILSAPGIGQCDYPNPNIRPDPPRGHMAQQGCASH